MKHTPYGYQIVDGKAVVDEMAATNIHKICDNYLSGMGLIAAATDVGLTKNASEVKRMIMNNKLLGDAFYPAILTEEEMNALEEERVRRVKKLGREHMPRRTSNKPKIYSTFVLPRIPEKYNDPIKQAEFAYSMIRSEVN